MTDNFSAVFADLHLLKHPFYRDWMLGKLPRPSLQAYSVQYHHHVDSFPRYLSAIHSHCEDAQQRRLLLENLNDEEGMAFGTSHPELWLQFAEGLGVSRDEVVTTKPGPAIRNVASQFFQAARASFHEGLGALYAYESQVPEIAESKIEGLKDRYGIADERTLAFFEVHRKADIEHREVILEMLESLPEKECLEAQTAARRAAQSLWDFLTEMHGLDAASA